jgi:predicted ATP-grasp superfamily ATP-dependent carboligase
MAESLIIVGASARAAAQSAVRAGYRPWCVDLFADRDLQAIAPVRRCPADQYPTAMLRLLDDAPPQAKVLLTGALENYPKFLEALAFEWPFFGSTCEAMQQVRDPKALASLPKQPGLRMPAIKTFAGPMHRLKQVTVGSLSGKQFLVKPRASAGGHGIQWWSPDMPISGHHYIQQYIPGQALSAVYRADGWASQMLGVTQQLVGEAAFGADTFQYCGSIGPVSLSERAQKAIRSLGVVLSQQYDLRGVFGVDLIRDRRDRIWPVEVNPRYPASTEIVEQMTGINALESMGAHRQNRRRDRHYRQRSYGKALLFAREPATIPDLYDVLPEHAVADVPEAGHQIERGKPICTIFATEPTVETCQQTLQKRATDVYRAAQRPSSK